MSGQRRVWRVLVLLVLALASLPHASGAATTFVVNTTADGEGPCTSDHCTLREAIQAANNLAGADTITFSIPGEGPHSIKLIATLPAIVDPVAIDGSSQPGFSGTPVIEVDGELLNEPGAYGDAFRISVGPSTIKNLAINDFIGGDGVIVGGSSFQTVDNVVVQGNYIGVDVTGQIARQNFIGIGISNATNVLIGGDEPHERNVVSGNYQGIFVGPGTATGSRIQGNYIGTTSAGIQALPNESDGIRLDGSGWLVGGLSPNLANVISGNGTGISLVTANSHGNAIQGNLIGTTASGGPLGNTTGVIAVMGATGNATGGTGSAANVIAHNKSIGVVVQDATGNTFTGNSIHSNQQLGIDLIVSSFQGRTPNDANDADSGSNDLQNYPIIESAQYVGTSLIVAGRINTTPGSTQRLEFFANSACDATGYGEGQTFVGSKDVTVGSDGNSLFSAEFVVPPGSGRHITASATNPAGSTSEFARCFDAGSSASGSTPTPSTSASPGATPSPAPSGSPTPSCEWEQENPREETRSGNTLLGVAIVDESLAWAVGNAPNDAGQGRSLVKKWNGSRWNQVPTPNVAGEHNGFQDVAVGADGDVWAVGDHSGDSIETLVVHGQKGDWRLVSSPSPGVGLSVFNGVDVAPNGTVYTVGARWDRDGVYHSVIARRKQGRWTLPRVGGALLHDVVAVANRNVWAVGQQTKDNTSRTFIVHFNGDKWTTIPSPNVNEKFHILRAVTATSPNDIWAAGSYYGANRRSRPLILHFNGTRWSVSDVPDLRGEVELWGISSASPDDVVAVGQASGDYPTDPRAILEWDGNGWTKVLHEDLVSVQLFDMDLAPDGDAWAVGMHNTRPFTSYVEHRFCG